MKNTEKLPSWAELTMFVRCLSDTVLFPSSFVFACCSSRLIVPSPRMLQTLLLLEFFIPFPALGPGPVKTQRLNRRGGGGPRRRLQRGVQDRGQSRTLREHRDQGESGKAKGGKAEARCERRLRVSIGQARCDRLMANRSGGVGSAHEGR